MDALNRPVGQKKENPILDSRIYEVEFPYGRIEEYSVNIIAENLHNMASHGGWDGGILDEVLEFRRDDAIAIPKSQGFRVQHNGHKVPIITSKGWDVKVRWKDNLLTGSHSLK